jgi:hypothetical protein
MFKCSSSSYHQLIIIRTPAASSPHGTHLCSTHQHIQRQAYITATLSINHRDVKYTSSHQFDNLLERAVYFPHRQVFDCVAGGIQRAWTMELPARRGANVSHAERSHPYRFRARTAPSLQEKETPPRAWEDESLPQGFMPPKSWLMFPT